jgi:hypothetical protein
MKQSKQKMVKARIYGLIVAVVAGSAAVLEAQDANQKAPPVHITVPLAADDRPKVFISNVGSETDRVVGKGLSFTGGPGQAYNKFYTAVQSSGQYHLVGSPAEADFVFEIRYTNPIETVRDWADRDDPPSNHHFPHGQQMVDYYVPHPQARLVISDPRTHGVHGVFTEFVELGHSQQEQNANFAFAIKLLVGHAASVLGRSPISGDVPNLANAPPTPPQIPSAKTVFIANAAPSVSTYNHFYAMMEKWGGYQLSPGTDGADLILELSAEPQLRVTILDPQTGVILWGFTPDMGSAILKRNSQKNVDQALAGIVRDIANFSGHPVLASYTPPAAKDTASSPDAPIPPQLSTAKKVFISNAGGEPLNDGKHRPLQPYNAFYATMKGWARFELVPTPADADLVLQVSVALSEPLILRLTILDSRTQATLWELDQDIHSDQTLRGSFAEKKDLDKATAALVTSLARLTGHPDAQITVRSDTQPTPPLSIGSDIRKVFISRPREESDFFEKNAPDQLYETLEADVRSWGRYELTTPGDADVILEPSSSDDQVRLTHRVRLTIRDTKTRHILWTFVRPVKIAFFNDSAIENYKVAMGLLVDDLRRVTSLADQDATKTAENH